MSRKTTFKKGDPVSLKWNREITGVIYHIHSSEKVSVDWYEPVNGLNKSVCEIHLLKKIYPIKKGE